MFTGLIQNIGVVASLKDFILELDQIKGIGDWQVGESINVNGCCLTLVSFGGHLKFELSPETLVRTNFGELKKGDRVNIERAMRPSDRFGGHIVQGHVDGIVKCVQVEPTGGFVEFRFQAEELADRYLVEKGSVALDGISLTLFGVSRGEFVVSAIPHSLAHTTLGERKVGDKLHIEYDVISKHLEKLSQPYLGRE